MGISRKLKEYLERNNVEYRLLAHTRSHSSAESALSAQIPPHQLAKAVVLEDEQGYIVGVLPSNNQIELDWVNETLGRHLNLASEGDLSDIFNDCDLGAVPALGDAYGLKLIWDDQLRHASDIYIEAGDHEHLVHIRGEDFNALMSSNPRTKISARPDYSPWV